MSDVHRRTTQYGFEFGAARVVRACDHKGYVGIRIVTPYRGVDIDVSPTGRTIHVREWPVDRKVWKPEEDPDE